MERKRPNPDELLAQVEAEEAKAARGKLKIFFGANAGVGKTYTMLKAAQKRRQEGMDVVVGYIELHGREETETLLKNLEILPAQKIPYKHIELKEFDLNAALQRRPALLLVDELAHTNVPGARHPKRWQDIEELLLAGIDVYTTVNVQHLESLNDVIFQITGVRVQETFPDKIFHGADEIELIDISPDELLLRLKEGKIYVPEQAQHAIESFFSKGNLIALRELALRCTAERVDRQISDYRQENLIETPWLANDRLLVCIGPDDLGERLVRSAQRMANALHARFWVVYVETPRLMRLTHVKRKQILDTLAFAEELGAKTSILNGQSVVDEILSFSKQHNVSKIIIGKPIRPRWRELLISSLVSELIRRSGDIDVYVITGEAEKAESSFKRTTDKPIHFPSYFKGIGIVAVSTALAFLMFPWFALSDLIMVYLIGIVICAMKYGRGPAILAALLGVFAFDFLFVPPFYSFSVHNTEHVVTFCVMLLTAVTMSHFADRLRLQTSIARHRQQRAEALYALSRELVGTKTVEAARDILVSHIQQIFKSEAAVLLPDEQKRLQDPTQFCKRQSIAGTLLAVLVPESDARYYPEITSELGVAQWAFDHAKPAGLETDTLPSAETLYLPLLGIQKCVGVLAVRPRHPETLKIPEQMRLLEVFANQAALAIERAEFALEIHSSHLKMEYERLKNLLLSSISHDFRTPLAVMMGSASSLLENDKQLSLDNKRELAQNIYTQAEAMNRLIVNLLELTRLESGSFKPSLDWHALDEMIGAVTSRLAEPLSSYPIKIEMPADLPLLYVDSVLIEQVFTNLLENAVKYSPPGSLMTLLAKQEGEAVVVSLEDEGAGLKPGEETQIFEKFYRGKTESANRGLGLGLAICQNAIAAHGGVILAKNRPIRGTCFTITLPLKTASS